MKSLKLLQTSSILIILMAVLVFPGTGFSVDPDMQALVIDNGSGMCVDKHGEEGELKNCDLEWDKLWTRLDRLDRMLMRIGNVKPDKKSSAKRLAGLCDQALDMLVDLSLDAANVENCCGDNQQFEDQFEFLTLEFSTACN